MQNLPLIFKDGHIFIKMGEDMWVFDTGAPTSFGDNESLVINNQEFELNSSYMGLDVATLSESIGIQCAGLLGGDVLGNFDHLIDSKNDLITITTEELDCNGQVFSLSDFMGIPIMEVQIAGENYRMFFDTGAQISYFQSESLITFPAAGELTDFYPGFGQFQTDTYQVEVKIGEDNLVLRCGTLPDLLGSTLMMADTQGIIGNQILDNRIVGYFPRRNILCL